MKRSFDLILAISGLLLAGPLMLATALLIKSKLGYSVLFKQERPGLNGKPFTIFKFRTMTNEQDENGDFLPDSKRLTAFGKLLRRLSLDEFPQLYNVLKGDMSMVGPRPLLMEYLPLYTEEQAKRNIVRPGITGLAQISGRNAISWEEKLKLDVWYVENGTFWLDLKIICLTVIKVFKSEGITQSGHATTERFTGTNSLVSSDHG